MAKDSPYSFKSVVELVNNNFGVFFISLLCLVGGFFIGSLWTENQLLKSGRLSGTGTTAAAPTTNTGAAPENKLTRDNFIAFADKLGVNKDQYTQCLDKDPYADKITQQQTGGNAVGVNATPTTVVVVNGQPKELIVGAQSYDQLKATLDKYLTGNGQPAPNTGLIEKGYVPVSNADHIRGNKNAKVVLVEYSDYQCPYCHQFHPVLVQAMNDYKDKIAWVYRHYPLTNIHPYALPAAKAAECVSGLKGEDAYWKFSDQLFAS